MIEGIPSKLISASVSLALAEDLGNGDVTASLLDQSKQVSAHIICREDAIFCGSAWADEVFFQLDPNISVGWFVKDGDPLREGTNLCRIQGAAAKILTGERSVLNFLQTLSATATVTARYVSAIADFKCKILDTRKTIPGLRHAQKYAVRCGGGNNHRMGLYDAFLIKENHIAAAGSIIAAVGNAKKVSDTLLLEIEVENLEQLELAIEAKVERILLDNFTLDDQHKAVAINAGRCQLEASGDINLDNVAEVAASGVDFISIGALTKHIRAVDLSFRLD